VLAGILMVAAASGGAAVAAALGDSRSGPDSPDMAATAPAGETTTTTTASVPVNTDAPNYDGVLRIGEQLTADPGTWDGAPDHFSYQWFDCDALEVSCPNIDGATDATYTLAPGDAGLFIGVEVVATNSSGDSAPVDSQVFGTVPSGIAVNQVAPTLTGAPEVGGTLTADNGTWSNEPNIYSYQWYSCDPGSPSSCQPIANANDPSYSPTADDAGQSIAIGVSATNENGLGDEALSALTAAIG
jgi:hypothetical protein